MPGTNAPLLADPFEVGDVLELVGLPALTRATTGDPGVVVGLLDGPVAAGHPDLPAVSVLPGAACAPGDDGACRHGTFVAAVLAARRGSGAAALCPGCAVLARTVLGDDDDHGDGRPAASADRLADALVALVDAGAHVVNVSAELTGSTVREERALAAAVDHAAARGTVVVAAAGNSGRLAGSPLVRHPWVVPVAACDAGGRPLPSTVLGPSIGRRGLLAPGRGVPGLPVPGRPPVTGTSAAAPLVTGTVALLLSLFPDAGTVEVRRAVLGAGRRRAVTPPLLDARAARDRLAQLRGGVP
jgi:subtilisin family serine protease